MKQFKFFLYACNLCRGPPRFEGDRPRFGDREGYRGGPRGAPGDFGGEKGGAPAEFQPSFRVITFASFQCFIILFIGFEHNDLEICLIMPATCGLQFPCGWS